MVCGPPDTAAADHVSPVSALLISGKTPARVAANAGALAEWLTGDGAQVPLADVAHTLAKHRSRFKSFASVSARDHAQAVAGLSALAAGESAPGVVAPRMSATGSAGVSRTGCPMRAILRRLMAFPDSKNALHHCI